VQHPHSIVHLLHAWRRLARAQMRLKRVGHSLQPTVLVHEAYLRLVKAERRRRWRARQGSCPLAASPRAAACLSTAGRRHLAQRDGAPGRGRTCDPRLSRSAPCSRRTRDD
jgi:hypothetical protein